MDKRGLMAANPAMASSPALTGLDPNAVWLPLSDPAAAGHLGVPPESFHDLSPAEFRRVYGTFWRWRYKEGWIDIRVENSGGVPTITALVVHSLSEIGSVVTIGYAFGVGHWLDYYDKAWLDFWDTKIAPTWKLPNSDECNTQILNPD